MKTKTIFKKATRVLLALSTLGAATTGSVYGMDGYLNSSHSDNRVVICPCCNKPISPFTIIIAEDPETGKHAHFECIFGHTLKHLNNKRKRRRERRVKFDIPSEAPSTENGSNRQKPTTITYENILILLD